MQYKSNVVNIVFVKVVVVGRNSVVLVLVDSVGNDYK